MNLLAELRRRNVIRMAGLYLVGAWLATQVAGTVLPIFGAPDWMARAVVILLAIGFIPTLVISWVFELTPQGLRREDELSERRSTYSGVDRRARRSDASADEKVASAQTARRLDRTIIVVLLVALVYFAVDKFFLATQFGAATKAEVTQASSSNRDLIAVLPFRNRSAATGDEYFVEGIHDDLLTQLSKVAGFKVISRTSMMHYVDSKLSIPEIAQELGAAVVLEGAVQRSGDQVRVNVQLIDGNTDVHLWAEIYDRALNTETLFEIQADIAKAIANAMKLVLSSAEASTLASGSTHNLQAYEAFLQGKLLAALDRATPERMQSAIQQFDRAIALDPQFADAWSRKVRAQLTSYWYGFSDVSSRDAAIVSMEQARRLAPEAMETWLAQAYIYYWGSRDYDSAEATLARVLERAPELAEAWCPRTCFRVVEGGARRRDSVEAGLRQCSTRYVAIHDGARPLLTPGLLGRVLTAAEGKPGAIAATRVTDTIKEVSGNRIVAHPDRVRLWAAQTPQVVLRQAWLDAAAMGDNDETDDAAMLSRLGLECEVVEAGAENLKITRPLDLDVAAALLQRRGEP